MNHDKKRNSDFEDRLSSELRAAVSERGQKQESAASRTSSGRRRGPRLALAGAAVAAIAVAVLIATAGGGQTAKAYALTPHDDGKISVEIRTLTDPKGLEHALDVAGVPTIVTYGHAAEACAPSDSVPSAEGASPVTTVKGEPAVKTEAAHLTIDPKKVGSGQTLVLTASTEGGAIEASAKVAKVGGPSVESSSPVPAEGEAGTCDGTAESPSTVHSERGTEASQPSAPSVLGVPATPSSDSEG